MTFNLLLFFFTAQSIHASAAIQLHDAYEMALKRMETIQVQQQNREQSQERLSQARGSLFPKLNATGQYERQDLPSSSVQTPDQKTVRLTLNQPLFQGLKEYAGLSIAKRGIEAEDAVLEHEKSVLFSNVAQNFFTILSLEQRKAYTQELLNLTEQRVKDLQSRERIGRSKKSEVLSSQSQLALVQSQSIEVESLLHESRENLFYLTGIPVDAPLVADLAEPPPPDSLDHYLTQAKKNRGDLKAALINTEIADSRITVARSGHLPLLDFGGNYYLYRTGPLEDAKWDFQLTLTIPLFQGGVVQSQVREAVLEKSKNELFYHQQVREVENEIKDLYQRLIRVNQQLDILKKAVIIAKQSYEQQARDYRFGGNTNLEVLQSLNTYIDTQQELNLLTFDRQITLSQLKTATGEFKE